MRIRRSGIRVFSKMRDAVKPIAMMAPAAARVVRMPREAGVARAVRVTFWSTEPATGDIVEKVTTIVAVRLIPSRGAVTFRWTSTNLSLATQKSIGDTWKSKAASSDTA